MISSASAFLEALSMKTARRNKHLSGNLVITKISAGEDAGGSYFRIDIKASFFLAMFVLVMAILACSSTPTSSPKQDSIPPSQTSPRASAGCLEGIIAGNTTREQVTASLGAPASEEANEDKTILLYATGERGQYHTIVIQNNLVGLVSIILDEQTPLPWSTVQNQYGKPALTTYSYFVEGTRTYIYPERGESFVASPDEDIVYARECFAPMSADDYMNGWGSSLPQENPFTR
jgi:hypothetical protein